MPAIFYPSIYKSFYIANYLPIQGHDWSVSTWRRDCCQPFQYFPPFFQTWRLFFIYLSKILFIYLPIQSHDWSVSMGDGIVVSHFNFFHLSSIHGGYYILLFISLHISICLYYSFYLYLNLSIYSSLSNYLSINLSTYPGS